MKILINTPDLKLNGGVSNHYLGLKDRFSEDIFFNIIGGRSRNKLFILNQIKDYWLFIKNVLVEKPEIVHLNPSLDKKAVLRDILYLILSKILMKKTLVFWHGWDNKFETVLEEKYSKIFIALFNLADAHIVLSEKFKRKLLEWGINKNIYIETTKVDDDLLKDFHLERKKLDNRINLLFLARIEKEKGIYEAISSYQFLKKKYPNLEMTIAGDGSILKNVKKYVDESNIKDVKFLGYVRKEEKINTFRYASIYIFPSYREGMPTSLLEAMAFGLPIITRPVGGISDIFVDGKMGYLIDSKEPLDFAEKIEILLNDEDLLNSISEFNYCFARNNYLASIVARRLENIYYEILRNCKSNIKN